jgi:rhomboid family GlyGly-CTERM serine protease
MSDANRTQDLGIREPPFATRTQGLWLLGLLVATVVLLSFGGEQVRLLLRYDRAAVIDAGEYWRLLTGHFVHGSITHMALNLAGMGLLAALFPRHYSLTGWIIIALFSAAAIDLGFVLYEPHLEWYVGLSGVLHGGLAAGAIAWWRYESKALALAITVILIGKLAWEQAQGALPLSGDMSVIVDAHLLGSVGGAIAGLLVIYGQHGWPRDARSL